MKSLGIPIPTLHRLSLYYQQLLITLNKGQEHISSVELGKATGSAPEQVRKDLSFLTGQGKSRVGYETKKLAGIIEDYLGLMDDKKAVLVGAGNLGHALASYPGFSRYGVRIVVLFDNDPMKVGGAVGDLKILPVDKLTNLVERMQIRIGIITTPPQPAQQIADMMIKGGIKAIWNFSTTHLVVPKEIMVRDVDLSLELAVISHYINSLSIRSSLGLQKVENEEP